MKKLIYIYFVLIFFASCQSLEDKKQNVIRDFITEKGFSSNAIKFISDDSATVALLDSTLICKGLALLDKINDAQIAIEEFQQSLTDDSKRIWLKTMLPKQKTAYDKIISLEEKSNRSLESLEKEVVISKYNKTHKQSKISVVECQEDLKGNEIIYILYFSDAKNPLSITGYHTLSKDQYSRIVDFLEGIHENKDLRLYCLENAGFDIVPIDEDPTKTREERDEIKRIQLEKELAAERRKWEEEEARKNRQIDNQIMRDLRTVIRYWNQQVPFQVDDVTIAQSAYCNNSKIYYNYTLLANKSDFSSYQWEALKHTMKETLKSNCQDVLQYFVSDRGLAKYEIKEAFERIGLSWTYIYRDINGRQLFYNRNKSI